MNQSKTVSVIVPVFNVEKYLDSCLESVTGQSHRDLEIILVDDGSTDSSGDKCEDWARKDDRIKIIHKANGGLNYARRDGFRKSSGNYITFVDSDDIIASNFIEVLVDILDKNQTDVSITGFKEFKDLSRAELHFQENIEVVTEKNKEVALRWLIEWNFPWSDHVYIMTAWGKIYKRSIIKQIDWDFSNYRANEDEFWTMQAFNCAKNGVSITNSRLYGYRQNPKSITRDTYINSYKGKRINKFQFIKHLYEQSMEYLGVRYGDSLAKRMGANIVDFVDIYTDRGVMNIRNILSAQRVINKYGETILMYIEDNRARRKIEKMIKLSVAGYVFCRKIKQGYAD